MTAESPQVGRGPTTSAEMPPLSMACPMGCGWEVGPLTRVDGGEVPPADNALSHMHSMSEHLREDHGARYPWE